MNEPPLSDPEDFQQELDALRLILRDNLKHVRQDRMLGNQVEFWMESARFLETELQIWENAGNQYKRQQALERMRKVLDILQELIDRMNEDKGDGKV